VQELIVVKGELIMQHGPMWQCAPDAQHLQNGSSHLSLSLSITHTAMSHGYTWDTPDEKDKAGRIGRKPRSSVYPQGQGQGHV